MEEELMTTGDAAAYLKVSRQRVDELGTAGVLPRRRVGRFWLYTRTDLARWRDEVRQSVGRPKEGAHPTEASTADGVKQAA